jgi:hypothetical protein|tara:strand:- start:1689 stop:1862 length:174 start_codon:yes stop_codon:yes gene_type:complete
MTYEETHKLVNAISALETWTRAIDRLHKKEAWDYDEIEKVQKWLDEAKQEIFEVASR